ncbi:hypothetical protein ACA910_012717 [Epithemia clementina (nom. ined.)]
MMMTAPVVSTARILERFATSTGLRSDILNQRPSYFLCSAVSCSSERLFSSVTIEPGSYFAAKKARKDRRRELYFSRLERKERVKTRRDGKPKGVLRNAFRDFFMPKRVYEIILDKRARQAGLDWKLEVEVILQRYHLLNPEKEQWEKEWDEMCKYIDNVRRPDYPKELLARFPKELYSDERDPISDEERERIMREYFPPGYVHPESPVTEADLNGNLKTINRQLTTSVFLFVKEGDNTKWHLPTVDLKDGETLLQAGRRAVDERVGKQLQYWCPGHAPMSVDMTPLESEEERAAAGVYGTKKFMMKFVHYSGEVVDPDLTVNDYAWLSRDEVEEHYKDDEKKNRWYHYVL